MWDLIKTKVLPPLLVVACVTTASGVLAIWRTLDKIEVLNQRVVSIEKEISEIKSQMVTVEVLRRIEYSLATIANASKENSTAGTVANALKNELDARRQRYTP